MSRTYVHTYSHPGAFVFAYGAFGPYCATCFDLACEKDADAGIHSSVTG